MTDAILDGGTPSGPSIGNVLLPHATNQQVLALVSKQLSDITGKAWPVGSTLLPYLNHGVKEICNLRPEAYTVTINAPLAPGVKQETPTGANFIVDAEAVLDVGNVPIGAVTSLNKDQMDKFLPGWYSWPTSSSTDKYIIMDIRNPRVWYVFPPVPAGTGQSISLICGCFPDETDDIDVEFPLENAYVPAAVDIIAGFCLREENSIPNALAKATSLMQSGYQKIGIVKKSFEESVSKGT